MISGNEQFERDFEAFLKEDDSRLAALYRKLPQPEPDAKLDAAVLAMAHRTLNPHLVATPLAHAPSRRRARWLAPIGIAAGLVLAAGVAVRIGPQVWNERSAAPASMRDNGVIEVRPIEEAPAPPPASPAPPPAEAPAAAAPAASLSMQAARPMRPKAEPAPVREMATEAAQQQAAAAAPAIAADRADVDAKELKKVENAASSPAPPQPFPGSGRREEMDSVERKQAIATGAWQKLHENDAAGGAPAGMVAPKAAVTRAAPAPAPAALGAAATPPPAARAKATAGPEAASATTTVAPADVAAAAPEQESRETRQTPYSAELTRNSRLYPESWIAAIQRLLHEGRRDEALENLELFHRKYPNYRLPADLKQLSASQK